MSTGSPSIMFRKTDRRVSRRSVAAVRWAIEALEDRTLMSTIVVNTAIDSLYPAGSGLISIRNAVATADSSTTPTTITFDPTVFAAAQTIIENGTMLTLSNTQEPITIIGPASGLTLNANGGSRGIEVSSGVTAEIASLTISNGQTGGYDFYGGGISNAGTLNLVGVTLSDNHGASGGGFSNSGVATLVNDTIAGNNSPNNGLGGTGSGSGVWNSGTITFNDDTIINNVAANGVGVENFGTINIANTIIAGNTSTSGSYGDASGTFVSYGYNLIGEKDGSSGWNGADLTGTIAVPLNPALGSLASNGGPTQTFLPQAGSPAIGAGSVAFVPAGFETDQRGLSRSVDGAVDIGAVETGGIAVPANGDFVVNSLSDTATGAGIVTLRDAIAMADADVNPTPNTITFDPSVFASAQTITLDGNELTLNNIGEPIILTGPTAALTLSGNALSRVLNVGFGTGATIANLTITDGNATDNSGDGGGIYAAAATTLNVSDVTIQSSTGISSASGGGLANLGAATLTGVTISGNTVTGTNAHGGGIYNSGTLTWNGGSLSGNSAAGAGGGGYDNGTISLNDVTVAGNTAAGDGGGIYVTAGTINATGSTLSGNATSGGNGGGVSIENGMGTFTNVTISGNSCTINGGAIELYSNSSATLTDDTLAGNTATLGGGLRIAGSATIGNTIIAQNTDTSGSPDVSGDPSSDGFNLIGATDGSSGWISSDLTGTAAAPLSPDLAALANNGGPTETLLPQAGGPVIGAGSVSLIPSGVTTDQRGLPRTVNGAVDIGAVEVQSGGQTGAAATSTTLSASNAAIASGDSVTLTAAVSSVSGQPTGAVTFLDNGGVIGSGQLISGTATLTTASLAAGSNSIIASYGGDSVFAASTSSPATIAVGAAPAIFIVDGAKGTIGEYATNGAAVNTSLVSGLAQPYNLSLLGNDLYVAELGSGAVGEYTTSGAAVNPSLISGVYPWGLGLSSTDIYVVDNSAETVSDYNLDGAAVNTQLITGLNGPGDIVADGPDLFIDNNVGANIRETTTAGATVQAPFLSGLSGASGMAISGSDLFVCNFGSNTVGEYTTSGATVNASLITGLAGPTCIAVYGDDLYVANASSGTVGEYTTSGATVNASLISGLALPQGIAVGGSISTTSPAASLTSVTASAQTIATGESEEFTATVAPTAGTGSAPTGAVTFLDNGAAIGSAQLVSGTAIFSTALPVGSNSITASYSGDSNYAPSASAALTQTILAASSATPVLRSVSAPTSGLAGGKFIAKVPIVITNTGSTLSGEFTVVLYLDLADSGLDANPIQLDKLLKHAVLKSGKGFTAPLKTSALPASIPSGTYHLVAEVTDPAGNVNFVTSTQTVTIAAAFVRPAATVGAVAPSSIAPGKSGSLIVTVANNGNVAASAVTIALSPSSDDSTPIAGVILDQIHSGARILPGKSKSFRLHFKVPSGTAAGTYYPYLSVTLGGVTTTTLGEAFTLS